MRNKINIQLVSSGQAVVTINGSTYDVDYSHDSIPFTAFKNGKCVSGAIESQWIFTKTNGAVGAAAFRIMLEQHEHAQNSNISLMSSIISKSIVSGIFSSRLWPLLYPRDYCLSYVASGKCDNVVASLMLLRDDCDEEWRQMIVDETGVSESFQNLSKIVEMVIK